MAQPAEKLSANDLWPIAKKLQRDEQLQLARRLLREAAAGRTDADAYAALPPGQDEFSSDDDALAWEGVGWDVLVTRVAVVRIHEDVRVDERRYDQPPRS